MNPDDDAVTAVEFGLGHQRVMAGRPGAVAQILPQRLDGHDGTVGRLVGTGAGADVEHRAAIGESRPDGLCDAWIRAPGDVAGRADAVAGIGHRWAASWLIEMSGSDHARANRSTAAPVIMCPSGPMTSQMAATAGKPAATHSASEASVWPARSASPPGRPARGKT